MHDQFTFFNYATAACNVNSTTFSPTPFPPPPLHTLTPDITTSTLNVDNYDINNNSSSNNTVYSVPQPLSAFPTISSSPSASSSQKTLWAPATSSSPVPPPPVSISSLPLHSSPALNPTSNIIPVSNPSLSQHPYGSWYDYIPTKDVTKLSSFSNSSNQFTNHIMHPPLPSYSNFLSIPHDSTIQNNVNNDNSNHNNTDDNNNHNDVNHIVNDQDTKSQQPLIIESSPSFSHMLPYIQEFVSENDQAGLPPLLPPSVHSQQQSHSDSCHQHQHQHQHHQQSYSCHQHHHHHHHLPHQQQQHQHQHQQPLIHLNDACGVVDYMFKSCSGKPYGGNKLSTETTQFKNKKTPYYQTQSVLEKTLPRTLFDIMDDTAVPSPPPTPICTTFDYSFGKLTSSESSYSIQSLQTDDSSSSQNGSSESIDPLEGYIKIPPQELLSNNSATIIGTNRVKNKLCKRFIYGKCHKRDCNFLHAKPLTVHRDQIIFLGGIPTHVGRKQLFYELKRVGLPVINLPMVIDRFTPRVVLNSKEAAQYYIEKKNITIFDKSVDVRPYKQSHEVYQIFLGGLLPETTPDDIRYSLKNYNCDLINIPTISKGYSINVEVKSQEQQKKLLRQKHIQVLGKFVEVKKITKRTKMKKRHSGY